MYVTNFCTSEGCCLFLLKKQSYVPLSNAMFYVDWDIIFKCRHYFKFKKFCVT